MCHLGDIPDTEEEIRDRVKGKKKRDKQKTKTQYGKWLKSTKRGKS